MGLTAKDKALRELALYIAEKSSGDEAFGATKLNKLLFYSDFLSFLNFGNPITGSEYFKLNEGPAPRRWVPVRKHLEAMGHAKVSRTEFYGFPQQRLIPLRPANLAGFTPQAIAMVDRVIALHWGKTAREISDKSHGFVGWILAKDEETIPYQVARVSCRPLTEKEIKHGKSLAALASAVLRKRG